MHVIIELADQGNTADMDTREGRMLMLPDLGPSCTVLLEVLLFTGSRTWDDTILARTIGRGPGSMHQVWSRLERFRACDFVSADTVIVRRHVPIPGHVLAMKEVVHAKRS